MVRNGIKPLLKIHMLESSDNSISLLKNPFKMNTVSSLFLDIVSVFIYKLYISSAGLHYKNTEQSWKCSDLH